MDNKRKAGSSAGDGDDRAAKRRKMPGPPTDYDLFKGESRESTTAYGLSFLEQIRRTKDKSGRIVAGYFEELAPREGNEDYYRRIRLPISLKTIERKLHNQDFENLAELESYFKRMVSNAKDYFPKGSEVFEDAERVRKALSNYMTKTNPAYKLIPQYSCQATPLPPEDEPEQDAEHDGEQDAEGEEDAEGEVVEGEDDAEGEEDDDGNDDDEDDEEEEEDDDDEDAPPRKIVIKRRGPGRPPKTGATGASSRRFEKNRRAKADHEYEGVPYKGLNFQQAQEKIVEELIRKPDGPDPYFLDFINLPPRTYKDYFTVIAEPLSLKGLQKLVKGIHGRQPATGVSDFKGWAAFEEKASLLWNNAHYYNEEGSYVYQLATELKQSFEKEVNEAKAVVQEPPQPKIKLKVAPGQETPVAAGAKKITIHVGGSRGSAAPSPAPATGQSNDLSRAEGAINRNMTPAGPVAIAPGQLDKARSMSASGVSPSPSITGTKVEAPNGQSPATFSQTNGHVAHNSLNMPNGNPRFQQISERLGTPLQNGHPPPVVSAPPPPPPVYDNKYRAPGKGIADALIASVLLRTHPSIHVDRRFRLEIPAHPKLAQQSLTIHIGGAHSRLQLIPRLAALEQQQRQYRLFVTINGQMVGRATPLPIPDDPLPMNAMVFDIPLQPGSNMISVQMIAALPKGQKLPTGADCELERITVMAHLLKA
ncbi:Bromodomain-containing protein [Diplogelasinospora grovesii]|uniref:Bromodomain-containing protein n=1 Tax=Diplogelasinospora grovesii TaxID=303347 RepID=A0AAN6NBK7_9PEZI|nr:Bromodomain-containing protein [Diplogelasinospora grovesii]